MFNRATRKLWASTLGLALAGAALALWLAAPGPAIIINDKPAPLDS